MLKRFFHHCSGADLTLLETSDCRTDHAKYVGVGTAVFFTAVFAAASSSYALFYVFRSVWVVVLGIVWGLFIFSLDRYIVSTMRKGVGWQREWGLAVPRLVIALFLALVISKPAEITFFNNEIENKLVELNEQEQTRLAALVTTKSAFQVNLLDSDLKRLNDKIDLAFQRRNDQADRTAKELNGSGGSKRYGKGPAYQHELEVLMQMEKELQDIKATNQPLIEQKTKTRELLRADIQRGIKIATNNRKLNNGLLGRIAALGLLSASDPAVNRAGWAIMLLFILIETAPVLVKLLSPAGPYDFKLNSIERQVEAREIEAISRANEEVNRSLQITLGENEQLVKTQLHGNQELLNKINQAQLEIAQEMINQWKSGELQKLRRPEPPTHELPAHSIFSDS